nr:hypothetical protein [Tanacetum cinerariifolium]
MRFLTPALYRSRRRRFMPAMPSPATVWIFFKRFDVGNLYGPVCEPHYSFRSLSLLIKDKQRSLSIHFIGVTDELKAFLRNVSKSTLRKGTKIKVKLVAHLLKVRELCRRNEMQIPSSVSYRIGLISFLWGKDEMVRSFSGSDFVR